MVIHAFHARPGIGSNVPASPLSISALVRAAPSFITTLSLNMAAATFPCAL
jgi:hypothetical protein